MHLLNESHVLLFLIQLFIIISLSRLFGEMLRRLKQPAMTAELLIGIILGPTILGRFFPEFFLMLFPADIIQFSMLETVAWIGVLFLLLDTGLEIDFSSAWRQRGNALVIAFSDIVIPMIIAFIPCFFLPDFYLADPDKRFVFSLYMAVVMTISAMPVASRAMHDLKILKTDVGFLTMSALAVNDIVGWVLFTIILGLFSQGTINLGNVIFVFSATIIFSVFALTIGRYGSNKTIDFFQKKKMPEPAASFTFACLLGLLFGAFSQKLGIHALFGFFIAGIVVGEAKNLKEETRTVISQMVHSLFVPVFFVSIGLKIDFISNFDFFLVLIVTVIGIAGRFLGAWIGVSLSKVPKINRTVISIAHTPGGMMEIVVALLAAEAGLITSKVFIAIVVSAVFSSIIMGPWLQYALNKRKEINILKYLKIAGGIKVLSTDSKTESLKDLIKIFPAILKKTDTVLITKQIFEREKDFSTAVGEGIAIPHIRIKSISEPLILFGLSRHGIDWNAADGNPVHFIFFLFSPETENDLHVEILSKIIKIIQDKNNQKILLDSEDSESLSVNLKNIFT